MFTMTSAQRTALQIAKLNNLETGKVRPALDTHTRNCSPCWVILELPDLAEVVYEEEPEFVESARNRPGRFVSAL
jgi:hypothetical protein